MPYGLYNGIIALFLSWLASGCRHWGRIWEEPCVYQFIPAIYDDRAILHIPEKVRKIKRAIFLNFVVLFITAASAPATTHRANSVASPEYVPNEIIVKFRKTVADALERQLELKRSARQLRLSKDLDELNAKCRVKKIKPLFKNFKAKRRRVKTLLKKDKALLTKKEKHILKRLARAPKGAKVPDLDRIYKIQVELEPDQSLEDVVAAYNSSPDVEYAELNYIVSINLTPNDPCYPIQWPLNNIGQMYPESGKYNPPPGTPDCDIDAPETWDIHTGSSEVIVAVVDTGVDYNHRDLQANMWVNTAELNGTEGIDDDENDYIDDIYGYDFFNDDSDPIDDDGHGTHCAGIIAAEADNGLDISGVCWNARIMAVKFLGVDTMGSLSGAAEALYYAVENGADIISNSWGEPASHGLPASLVEACDYVYSQGVIMVASAGNEGKVWRFYPANCDHVIAVAATDSNDAKASFSTYGYWVEIAAPGVDVLSLLADGTSTGTPYDSYTTIMSGTSMACPHVSGACAILLSIYPGIKVDEVRDVLQQSADPIAPGVCASGRLNLHQAVQEIARCAAGEVTLDRDVYSCSDTVQITVRDFNLVGMGTQEVTVTTSGGDFETVALMEVGSSGVFTSTILTTPGDVNIFDGAAQVGHDQSLVVIYYDDDDGTGSPAVAIDSAILDCQPPLIFNVQFDEYPPGPEMTITFETDELTTARILCGLACGGPYASKSDNTLATTHIIQLADDVMQPDALNYFVIDVNDALGNNTIDDNNGTCYTFTTTGPRDMNVPSEYATIQEPIDIAWDGSTIWVADGTYTGPGNKNIDFRGKAITLRSENGPQQTIIDCENDGRSFYFHGGETLSSRLEGFTICNGGQLSGYIEQAGIWCDGSSPTIINCIIRDNSGFYDGGILCENESNPVICDCTFIDNHGLFSSGVRCKFNSHATITNCTFSGGDGTAIHCQYRGSASISNCVIYGIYGTAPSLAIWISDEGTSATTITNCIVADNYSPRGTAGIGCTRSNPIITNCTIVGNSCGDGTAGGIGCYDAHPTIRNCIIWGNEAPNGPQIVLMGGSNPEISYCDIQGGWEGPGNINADPCFADVSKGDYHLKSNAGRWHPSIYTKLDPTGDGFINLGDFAAFAGSWHKEGKYIPADLDGSGVVDSNDLKLLLDNYLTSYSLGAWVVDDVNSPCIDAGDPNSNWTLELWPHGKRTNTGAYGGLPQASMSLSDAGNIADLNNNGFVDFVDLNLFTDRWLSSEVLLPEDLDRNGFVNFTDFAIFADQYPWQQ